MRDRLGLEVAVERVRASPATTLFLAALVFFAAYWRVDVFIVDTVALANALANVADGSLRITTVYFGPADLQTPGIYVADGQPYGRNYGQVAAALPILYLLKAVSLVAAPRLLLAGVWSVCLAALAGRLSTAFGAPWLRGAGISAGVLVFLANTALGTALAPRLFPLVALQMVTLLAASGLVAVAYLLMAMLHDHRIGVAAGIATLLAGPIGFWATIPKRHAITAFLVLLTAYLFARSRHSGLLRDRAGAYLPVGLTAWVSAPEGLLLLAALASVDLATCPDRDPRSLAVVGAALGVSLLPFLLTNALIAGNPVMPPRSLTSFRHGGVELLIEPTVAPSNPTAMTEPGAAAGGGGDVTDQAAGRGDTNWSPPSALVLVTAVLAAADEMLLRVTDTFRRGVAALSPGQLYHVFVRSGRIPGVDYSQTGGEAIELTLLESVPLLAALAALPVLGLRRGLRSLRPAAIELTDPRRATDTFAIAFAVIFTLPHLARLPVYSSVTVRYLVPVVPLLVYGVFRLAPVRRVVWSAPWTVVRVALVATVLGGLARTAGLAVLDPSVGTLLQAHAVVNLGVAALVAGWLIVRPGDDRLGATVLGVAAAAMCLFLLGTGFEYFADGREYLLPVARLVAATTPIDPQQ